MEDFTSLQSKKARLRKDLRKKCNALTGAQKLEQSRKVAEKLIRHPRFLKSRKILVYVSLPSEIDTLLLLKEILKQKKQLCVPRIDDAAKKLWILEVRDMKELQPGSYGVLEPPMEKSRIVKEEELDLIIVPGLGFDNRGARVGRGMGYFDRLLAGTPKAFKIGLAFKCQMMDEIPVDEHDVLMNEVVFP